MKNDKKDILSGLNSVNRGLNAPEGYFDDLQARLSAIPSRYPAGMRSNVRTFVPALAGIAAALIAGIFIFTHYRDGIPNDNIEMLSYEQCTIADLIPRTDPYIYFPDDIQQTNNYSDEEITEYFEYLIEQ